MSSLDIYNYLLIPHTIFFLFTKKRIIGKKSENEKNKKVIKLILKRINPNPIPIPNPQSPIPIPQSPIPSPQSPFPNPHPA